jgi:spore germination cell wall hydrolase CwlJ-like protein
LKLKYLDRFPIQQSEREHFRITRDLEINMKPLISPTDNIRVILFAFSCLWLVQAVAPSAGAATYGQQVIAAVLMGEAEGEGERGMIAVAEVIRKRADQKGISPLAIVKEPRQFSCLNGLTPPQLIRKHWRKKDWETALKIARLMYNTPEKLPGITRGATHYATFIPKWARGHQPVAVIGNHYFWRFEDV